MRVRSPIAALLLTACGLAPLPQAAPVEFDVTAVGGSAETSVVRVASGDVDGETWTVAAFRADDGSICLADGIGSTASGSACAQDAVQGTGLRGITASIIGADQRVLLYGGVSQAVQSIRVETAGGTVDATVIGLDALGTNQRAMAVLLPGGADATAFEALDASGAVIERIESPGFR